MTPLSETLWALFEDFETFSAAVVGRYFSDAPIAARWAEDIARRMREDSKWVSVFELRAFARLMSRDEEWMGAPQAATLTHRMNAELSLGLAASD